MLVELPGIVKQLLMISLPVVSFPTKTDILKDLSAGTLLLTVATTFPVQLGAGVLVTKALLLTAGQGTSWAFAAVATMHNALKSVKIFIDLIFG